MLKIDFTREDIDKLHYERYHHPHPLVQKKMEVLYLKSQGVKHKDICSLCQISKTTLTIYMKKYQSGGVEELKKIDYKGQPSKLNEYSDILKEHFEKCPASSVAEASVIIEKLTGIKRSQAQVREFMKRTGLRCYKSSIYAEKVSRIRKN
ncbi:MAG: helix-turn-helix domain-containing protein [Nostochopsis sp.]